MGTRADFYVGRGAAAEWLGSIAWDGYPATLPRALKRATTEQAWRDGVTQFLARREDASTVADGWPWAWKDSNTTDYAYAFDGEQAYGTGYGSAWFPLDKPEPKDHAEGTEELVFPDMSAMARPVLSGARSGFILFRM